MDRTQIAFIICANNDQYYNECVRYIQDIEVPKGYCVDIICIQDADSMAQGYNAGMKSSNAKYKVYLHQDTFILNQSFIYDILSVFQRDENIGMLGVIGAKELCSNANCYLNWNIGKIQAYRARKLFEPYYIQPSVEEYIEVNAVDGLIMITQYDVPWREDFLDGWDFYDISQALEMKKRGYNIVVPYQETAWCYHDCGVSNLKEYNYYRKKMIQEYPEVFTENEDEIPLKPEEISKIEHIRKNLIILIEAGAYEELDKVAQEIRELWLLDTQIREIVNIMEIYSLEKESISGIHSEWLTLGSWEAIYEYYKWIHFILLRIEHEREDERAEHLRKKVKDGMFSRDAVRKMSSVTLNDTSNIYKYLLKKEREEPLVSVIIAVYNGESIIRETVDSILQQTYNNIEIIIVDDASTDNSRDIISSYKDARIKSVFSDKNRHVCYTGNIGFQIAKGKYVALIGHDDVWKADKLEKQIDFMEEHPSYSICFTWVDIIDENKNIVNNKWSKLYETLCVDNLSQNQWGAKLLIKGNCFCAPSACIRREFLERTGYYRYGLVQLQDYDLWMRLLCEGPVHILQEKLTYYRRFSQGRENLSAINLETQNRHLHEIQWIQESYLEKLSKERFINIFKERMKNPNAKSEKEVLCEKAFLLWDTGNCFAERWFIELLEDEECRNILEDIYQFELKDFYQMNAQTRTFDNALVYTINQQEELLKQYKKMI